MLVVPDPADSSRTPTVSAVLCVETDALDRFGRVLRHLSVGLVDQAVALRVVSSDERVRSLTLGPVQALTHPRLHWPGAGRRIERLLDALSPHPPTVVHAMSHASYRLASAIAQEYDADLVLQVSSLADCEQIAASAARTPAHVHASSQPLANVLTTQMALPPADVEVIRPGVAVAQRISCFSDARRVATILCTSVLEAAACVDRLIDAAESLQRRGLDFEMFLLGDGPHEARLRRQVRSRRLSACITFSPRLDDPATTMQSADILVRPSADTAFTADTLQAMAAGLLVVSEPNAAADYLHDGETAVVYAPSTTDALADALHAALRDRPRSQHIATAGLEYVRRHHGISAMAEQTAAAYRKLALTRTTFAIRG